ncbi:MAG: hypothetical protein JNJ90_11435 [Saprospiraceae bacterium]|nr:hypothetical protein [Saprospiraceae bacterium]
MRFFALILIGLLHTGAVQALTFSISPTPQTVSSGSAVSVEVQVSDFSNIAGYQFSMSWNPAVLQFQSVTPGQSGMTANGNFGVNAAAGTLAHLFYAQNPGTLSPPDGSTLFTLNFIAVGAAGTSSPVEFTAVPTPIVAYNGNLQPVAVTPVGGVVHISAQGGYSVSGTVTRPGGTPVPDALVALTGAAAGNDLTGPAGDYGFANLAAGSNLTITPSKNTDPAECVSVRDILFIYKHILGLEALPNPYAMAAADANRSRSITSFDATELRKLILGIYANLPNTPSWRFIPADYVFPNPNNPFQEVFPETAQVTDLQTDEVRDFVAVKTGDATNCVGDAHGPAFLTTLASSASGQQGQQVTIDVTVQGFSDVSGLQFSLQWDPSVAQFTGLSNLNVAGLDDNSFNTSQAASGKLSLCWWSNLADAGPQTLLNGSVLFSLTFTLVGANGSSTPLAFVQTPTKFEVVNGNCEPFGLNFNNGLITVTSQPPPPPENQLLSGNGTSVNGAPICVPITMNNFTTDVGSAQFTMAWSPAVFSFMQVQNLLPALGLGNTNFNTAQSGSGVLTFSWIDQTLNGVAIPNSTVLFEVCLAPVGPPGSSTQIQFPDAPVPVAFTDSNGDALNVHTVRGTLNITDFSANPPITFSVSPTPQTVASGQTVTVDIRVSDFTDMAGYQFSMSWDPAVLQFQSVTPGQPDMSAGGNFNTGNSAGGVLSHLFFVSNPNALTLPDGSALFSLHFLAVGAAGTSSHVSFTSMPTPKAAYKSNLQAVPMTMVSGVVHIAAQAGFTVSGNVNRVNGTHVPDALVAMTGDAAGSDLTGTAGDYGFANLAAGSDLTITPTKTADPLECVSVRDILFIYKHILGLEPLPNPYAMAAADANKSRSITTFDAVELRKLILGIYSELPNNTSWRFIPADYVFPNPNNPFQEVFPETAQVTNLQADEVRDFVALKTGDVTDCVGDTHGPAFLTTLASSASGAQGQQVTIDVTVQGFTGVSGLQFSLQWDPSVAQFAGLSNLNVAGLDDNSFNTSQAASGKLSLCWWANLADAGPQTLLNGSVLFSLTFTLVGANGSSTPVAFVQTPTKFEVVNGNCDPFDLNTGNGLISISSQPPPPAGIQLFSGNATSVNGAVVCVPVCTSNFTDIVSAQFSLGWDPVVFGFQQVQNFHPALVGLNGSNFFTAQSGNGLLGFGWYDLTLNGVSLPNGAVLFDVCFTPLGPNGSSTPLGFPNTPVPLEIADEAGVIVPAQTTSGTLNIVASGANPITISVSPNVQTVPSGTPVSVDIVVEDFTDMAGYQFSMSWNPAVLQFQSVTPALPGMSASNFNLGIAAAGKFAHLYFRQGVDPFTLPDGAKLFTLNFIAVGAAGSSSPVEFTAMPTPIVAYNAALQAVPVVTQAGVVHISGNGDYSVSGTIARPGGTPVPGVSVELSGDANGTDLTGTPGEYLFDNLSAGSNLTVTPSKIADPTECVSVRDILFIYKHFLGIMPLPSPYAMVAADANGSRSITTFDAVELRKLILGIYANLPNASSWRFIPADYVFPNPNNLFQEVFPETAQVTDLQTDEVRDFVAIKTGDATNCVGDAHGPAFLTTLASSAIGLPVQQVTIDVTVQNFADVSGLQFSLQWDPAVAQFDGLINLNPTLPGLNAGAIYTGQSNSGYLSVCWLSDPISGSQALPDGAVLFSLTFTLVGPPGSNTPVAFVQTPTRFEVVNGDYDPFGLNFGNGLISVLGDTQPCSITCPGGLPPLTANSSCRAALGDYTGLAQTSGDCDSNIPVVQSPAPGTIVNPGTVAITLTASGNAGQSAKCVFNVTISGGCH